MKHLILIFILIFATISATDLYGVNTPETKKEQVDVLGVDLFNQLHIKTIDDFVNLTPRKIRHTTGERLKLKQIIALKVVQKKMKKKLDADAGNNGNGKSQLVALILAILFGAIGVHRFYLGYIGIGIIQILTLGGFGIWYLIDIILIATGALGPKNDSYESTL
jgi:type IV secretory pathway VirB6-like protein